MSPPPARLAPIDDLVERIRRETGLRVPDVAREGPGTRARMVGLLREPAGSSPETAGVPSPRVSRDGTSRNWLRLAARAGVDPAEVLCWNAVPWHRTGGGRSPSDAQVRAGAPWLGRLLGLLPPGTRVVAFGDHARRCCVHAGLTEGRDWRGARSLSDQGLGTPPTRGARPPEGRTWREVHEQEIVEALRWAAGPAPAPARAPAAPAAPAPRPPGLLRWLLNLEGRRRG